MFRNLSQFKRESISRSKAERDLDTNLYRFHKVISLEGISMRKIASNDYGKIFAFFYWSCGILANYLEGTAEES